MSTTICVNMKLFRFYLVVLCVSLVFMFWLMGEVRWNYSKQQRNDMRRHRAVVRERVDQLETKILILEKTKATRRNCCPNRR